MKILKTGLLCLLLSVCVVRASAQIVGASRHDNLKKPELFHDLPRRMDVNAQSLAPLLQKEVGENVAMPLASGFTFTGVVVSRSSAAELQYKTVVIRSTNRPGATLAITGVRSKDGSIQYSGRMLSLKHSDAYEMKNEGGQLALEKTDLADLVSE